MNAAKWILTGLCAACIAAHAGDDVRIFPDQKGVQINHFFYDLKSPSAPRKFVSNGWANTLLEDYGFDGVRTSIYGNGKKPAHPEPGVVIEQYYQNETRALKLAREINPDVIIFASKKLDNTDSFPAWTKNFNGVIPEQYALLLIDYLEYMKREGLEVDVLGIDNERRFNEGDIMPVAHHAIVEELRRLTKERGLKMPRIIGHEDFAMGRDMWMWLYEENAYDSMDIFGGHYYPEWRHLERLKSDLKYAGEREKWHTELHWDSKPDNDPLLLAVKAYLALWDCTDNGMNGFMWWDLNPLNGRIRNHLMHAVTVPLVNAWPVAVTDPDGSETVDVNQLHTRAFLQGGTLTVYALNLDPSRQWNGLSFRLDSGRIAGQVRMRQWSDGCPPEGNSSELTPLSSRSYTADLGPRTITRFQFDINE